MFLGEPGVHPLTPPLAIVARLPPRQTLASEPALLRHLERSDVGRVDVGLHPVQPLASKRRVKREREQTVPALGRRAAADDVLPPPPARSC